MLILYVEIMIDLHWTADIF